jgi:hypothetical protein
MCREDRKQNMVKSARAILTYVLGEDVESAIDELDELRNSLIEYELDFEDDLAEEAIAALREDRTYEEGGNE